MKQRDAQGLTANQRRRIRRGNTAGVYLSDADREANYPAQQVAELAREKARSPVLFLEVPHVEGFDELVDSMERLPGHIRRQLMEGDYARPNSTQQVIRADRAPDDLPSMSQNRMGGDVHESLAELSESLGQTPRLTYLESRDPDTGEPITTPEERQIWIAVDLGDREEPTLFERGLQIFALAAAIILAAGAITYAATR